ncbi:MAG: hypothetical protein GXY77_06705 [Fibrobacter sp.]|nr:hypothetical protein [Fibrobacter sp.]
MSAPKTKFQKFARYLLISSAAFVALIILIVSLSPEPEKTASAPVTREEKISQIVKKSGGDSISVKLDSIFVDQGGYRADIEYTINDRKIVMLSKAMDIMKEIYADPALNEIQSCMLRPHTVFINSYGQETVSQAAKLVLYRKVAQKVVWANFTYEMYENLLKNEGQLWIHPGMR